MGEGASSLRSRTAPVKPSDRRNRRVVESHRMTSAAFRLAGMFGVVALGWGGWVLWKGGSWWGPLHSFVAGTVILVISGATQMFTTSWSSAPAPDRRLTLTQRWLVTVGVTLALVGRSSRWEMVVGIGAVAVMTGLITLGFSIVTTLRRSLLRRFDLSARFYVVALGAGATGVGLGGLMGAGMVEDRYLVVRTVHLHLNLVGFVGMVIVGTIPTLLPTFAQHKAVSGREAVVGWWLAVASVLTMATGLLAGDPAVGVGSILGAVSLLMVAGGVVVRLGRRGLTGRLPYLQVTAGGLWLAGWAIQDGMRLLAANPPPPFAGGVAVVAGIGQILLGSLGYLIPVLAGPGPRLGRNLERTHRRMWLPLVTANGAGVMLALGLGAVAVGLVGVWLIDFAGRLATLERRQTGDDSNPVAVERRSDR